MEKESGGSLAPNWNAQQVAVSSLVPFEKNPRKISAKEFERLKSSLTQDGYHQRILATPDLRIIGGHQRIRALTELGIATIEVLVPDCDIDDEQFMRILVRDNLAYGEWDLEPLADLMPMAELTALGIPDADVRKLENKIAAGLVDDDAVPEIPAEPVSAPGDVWLCGAHRVMCGDSTSLDAVTALMAGEKAQTFFTDPPYGGNVGGLRTKTGQDKAKASRDGKGLVDRVSFIANDKEIKWLEKVFNLVVGFLEPDSTKMVFFKWDHFEEIKKMANAFGEPSALCVWDKVRKASSFFRFQPQHELLFHWGNQADKKNPSSLSNVWREPKESENRDLHPTVKPIAILEPAILVTTDFGKIVLDLFGGSGSTLIACEKLQRQCRMMELDPKYCDVIVKRWQDFTGQQARLESTGDLFADRKAA